MRINCHLPIAVRINGVPTADQLPALSAALSRAVAARLKQAERMLAQRNDFADPGPVETRERFDPEREGTDAYAVPSYEDKGKPAEVNKTRKSAEPAEPKPARPPRKAAPARSPAGSGQPNIRRLRRDAVKSPDAAEQLVDIYSRQSDSFLRRRARLGDETAKAILRQRIPSNEAALQRILGSDYRPPHEADVRLLRRGVEVWRQHLRSGNMTDNELALGFPENVEATHTEARAVRDAPWQRGDVMFIEGQYNPCSSCREAMRNAAGRLGVIIVYIWPGGRTRFLPPGAAARPDVAVPGEPPVREAEAQGKPARARATAPASADPARTEPAGTARTEPVGTARTEPVGTARTEPVGTARTEPVGPARSSESTPSTEPATAPTSIPAGRPPVSNPATTQRSVATRAAAGVAGGIMAVNELLGAYNRAKSGAQAGIDLGLAEISFWSWAGANPVTAVWDSWAKVALPPDTPAEATAFGSQLRPYVVDIDVNALRQSLPGKIHSYDELVYFLDSARELNTIEEFPRIPNRPDVVMRTIAENLRYFVTVNRENHAHKKIYEITDVIAPLRIAMLAKLDTAMRAQVGRLSAPQRHQIHRLKHGPETKLYRSRGGRFNEQPLVSAQRSLGPDPWVRLVNPGSTANGRVQVTPVNADAARGRVTAYLINRKIGDVEDEVTEAGRPILHRDKVNGVMVSFVAGPQPGDPRFGNTRYVAQDDGMHRNTIAIGELNVFWVDADDIELVPDREVEQYQSH